MMGAASSYSIGHHIFHSGAAPAVYDANITIFPKTKSDFVEFL